MTIDEIDTRLDQYAALEPGWNSYDAAPITPAAIAAARAFVRETPAVPWWPVPLADGGVQLEVHRDGYDFEVEVESDGETWSALWCPDFRSDICQEVSGLSREAIVAFVRAAIEGKR